jgi:Tannase and feruloyl esterase
VFTPPTQVSGGAVGVLDYLLTFVLDRDAAKVFATEETYGGPIDFPQPRRQAHRLPCNSGAVFSINDTIAWYERVRAAMGGNVGDFVRLFEVSGMNHGGPATDKFDLLTALVDWVERGAAPERVVASAGTRRSGAQSGGTVDLAPRTHAAAVRLPCIRSLQGTRRR